MYGLKRTHQIPLITFPGKNETNTNLIKRIRHFGAKENSTTNNQHLTKEINDIVMKNIITNYKNHHGWKTSTSAESNQREILKHT